MNISRLKIYLILICFPFIAYSQSGYFSDPNLYSSEELAQALKEKRLDMSWRVGKDSYFRFVSKNDEVYFEICLGTLPEIYKDFIARVKDKCIEQGSKLIFSYRIKGDGSEEINQPQDFQDAPHPDEYSYIAADRRVVKDGSPRQISPDELAAIIKNKGVLFYTGAGLSMASSVPGMVELNDLLGLEASVNCFFSLEKALDNPREFASKIKIFHQACFSSPPTKAHLALKELAVLKNVRIVTENLDTLHEASGINPYRVEAGHFRELGKDAVAQFDYVICVGLSYDDRGFLGWYKSQVPHGVIIAVDLGQPSYLGDEDFLVKGDLQKIIPEVQKKIAL
jgi:NAD-dependent SIR2 family protein deacetylase